MSYMYLPFFPSGIPCVPPRAWNDKTVMSGDVLGIIWEVFREVTDHNLAVHHIYTIQLCSEKCVWGSYTMAPTFENGGIWPTGSRPI